MAQAPALTINANWTEGNGSAGAIVNVSNGGTLTTNGVFTQSLNGTANISSTFKANALTLAGNFNQTGGSVIVSGTTQLNSAVYKQSAGIGSLGAVNLAGGSPLYLSGTAQLTTSGPVNLGTASTGALLDISARLDDGQQRHRVELLQRVDQPLGRQPHRHSPLHYGPGRPDRRYDEPRPVAHRRRHL